MTEVRSQSSEVTRQRKAGMKPGSKKIIFLALCSLLLAPCFSVEAQQLVKVPRVGFLTGASLSAMAGRNQAFRQGLRDLGYVEGKNIVIEWRSYGEKRIGSARSWPNLCVST